MASVSQPAVDVKASPLEPGAPCPVCGKKMFLMMGAPVNADNQLEGKLFVWLFCSGAPECGFFCSYEKQAASAKRDI